MYNADSLRQVILQDIRTENYHLLVLSGIIILSALIGGLVSWVFRNDPLPDEQNSSAINNGNDKPKEVKKYSLLNALLVGLAGAVIVPLFLNLGGNGILKDSRTNPANYFAFAGFCVLGAVFARDFLNSMGKTLLKRVDDLDKKIDDKVKDAMKMKEEAQKESSQKIIDSNQVLRKEIEKKLTEIVNPVSGLETTNLSRNLNDSTSTYQQTKDIIVEIDEKISANKGRIIGKAPDNDPQKNQWGGLKKNNEREISAVVTKLHKYWYQIDIEIRSLNINKPIEGPVFLYVHDSLQYKDNRIVLYPDFDGIVREELRAYGSFTVGAVCDKGDTILEYDLVDAPGGDKYFKEN